MADKQGWPVHAQAAWEHEKRRGDRLYQALCDMERQRDDALRALARAEIAEHAMQQRSAHIDHLEAKLESAEQALAACRALAVAWAQESDTREVTIGWHDSACAVLDKCADALAALTTDPPAPTPAKEQTHD